MSFLAGWGPIALAAGLTIPPLVALYFLKLRRQTQTVSSTLLWKRAVEDLQVNAPFQRIRNNLLLWLQLLVLALAALALGRPVMNAAQSDTDTLILLVDQSASMGVVESDGRTRLEIAQEQAKTEIANLPRGGRGMIIGFCDRAVITSDFETDKRVLQQRLAGLTPTESSSTLSEALTLAEAYMQHEVVVGGDNQAALAVTPARVVVLTDGNIEDAGRLTVRNLPTDDLQVVSIGQRSDNVAIVSMDAQRNFDQPALLEVFAAIRNFGPERVTLDANLYIDDQNVDVQTITLEGGAGGTPDAGTIGVAPAPAGEGGAADAATPPPGSVMSLAFDGIRYEGGGVVEVRLRVNDALAADNVAWTVVQPPRRVSVLLVTTGDVFLERALRALSVDLQRMTPEQYEAAGEDDLAVGGRSKWDVVMLENHSTARLAPGGYIFFGGAPQIDGLETGAVISDEILFNWDETNPILRYVSVGEVQMFQWRRLTVPSDALRLIEGESSPVLAYLARDGRQFLISAAPIIASEEGSGEPMLNTDWVLKPHFPVFLSNALQYLAGSLSPSGLRSVQPGEPISFPVADGADEITVRRPDGESEAVATGGRGVVDYNRTRRVGIYRARPGVAGQDRFAVNLFNTAESDVAPTHTLTLAGRQIAAADEVRRVNRPLWPWFMLAALGVLCLEWFIYTRRVRV